MTSSGEDELMEAILVSQGLSRGRAAKIHAALSDGTIGFMKTSDVRNVMRGAFNSPEGLDTKIDALLAKVKGVNGALMTTAAEENALTAMVRGCLAASKDSGSELNRELGVRGVSSEDKDGQIIVRTSEVEELRKAEAALAGGALPMNLKPSSKMIAYHVRGERMDPPTMRAFDLRRACTEFGARKTQKLRGQAETDFEKLIGDKEYDEAESTDTRVIPAVQKIMLDALARGTASATFRATKKITKSGAQGYLQDHAGKSVIVAGGRQMALNVLDQIVRYGPGKSGDELLELYAGTIESAAGERERTKCATGPALDLGMEKERLNWQREPERITTPPRGDTRPPDQGGGGGKKLVLKDCCPLYNAGKECDGTCNKLHKCNFRLRGGRLCGQKHPRAGNHESRGGGGAARDDRSKEAEAPALTTGAPAASAAGALTTAGKQADRQVRLDVLRNGGRP